MKRHPSKKRSAARAAASVRVARLLPNMITVMALCTGLTAIRFAWDGHWEIATAAILLSAVLDGMDGRLARLLGSTSDFGAELDSLSDFLCFGAAPSILIYATAFSQWRGIGWAFCLLFCTCTALRLARFNVDRLAVTGSAWGGSFSVGVPAPAGAFIALLPLMLCLASGTFFVSPLFFVISTGLSAFLMISRIPTFTLKNVRLSRPQMATALLSVTLLAGGIFSAPWETLFCLGLVYLLSIPLSFLHIRRLSTPPASSRNLKTESKIEPKIA